MTLAQEIEAIVLAAYAEDREISPADVAMELVDREFGDSDDDGTMASVDLAASEYLAVAARVMGVEL